MVDDGIVSVVSEHEGGRLVADVPDAYPNMLNHHVVRIDEETRSADQDPWRRGGLPRDGDVGILDEQRALKEPDRAADLEDDEARSRRVLDAVTQGSRNRGPCGVSQARDFADRPASPSRCVDAVPLVVGTVPAVVHRLRRSERQTE